MEEGDGGSVEDETVEEIRYKAQEERNKKQNKEGTSIKMPTNKPINKLTSKPTYSNIPLNHSFLTLHPHEDIGRLHIEVFHEDLLLFTLPLCNHYCCGGCQ
jgi:hypothetical protein